MNGKYEVHLCRGCIRDLEDYYPYNMPREQLRIVGVAEEDCDNSHLDDYNERLRRRNSDFF